MNTRHQAWDNITLEDLRATGATKWAREDGAIGAFIAEMDFGIAEPITQALHEHVDSGSFGYMPTELHQRLQTATAQHLKEDFGWPIEPKHIHEMADVLEIYRAAISHFSAPGSKIIISTPSYMPFLFVAPLIGREVIEVPMVRDETGDYALNLAGIDDAFADGGGILIMVNPHNPTGRIFRRDELQAVSKVVAKHNGRVFSDEIWAPLTYTGHAHIPYASTSDTAASHTITAVAASKAFNLPGLKCAQLVTSNDDDLAYWEDNSWLPMHGAANLGLTATIAAYQHGGEWLEDLRTYLERNRDFITKFVNTEIHGVSMQAPAGTYVGWLDCTELAEKLPAGTDLQEFFLERAGVACTPGAACGKGWENHLRFIFAMPYPVMVTALEKMHDAVHELN